MSEKGRTESGAELLARLGPRPSLRTLEAAKVLGFEPFSWQHCGAVWGRRSWEKTEVLLHLVTSALLPNTPTNCCHGDKTEVIWVDCDLKFSVLRLAILLEQRLVNEANMTLTRELCGVATDTGAQSGEYFDTDNVSDKHSDNYEPAKGKGTCVMGDNKLITDKDSRTGKQTDGLIGKNSIQTEKSGFRVRHKAEDMENDEGSGSKGIHKKQDVCGKDRYSDSIHPSHIANKTLADTTGGVKVDPGGGGGCGDVGSEDAEQRVEGCLRRVQVVRCTSSQQLICTLHSLHTLIANNRNVAILIIDPISSFSGPTGAVTSVSLRPSC